MTGGSSEAADDNVRHAARRALPEGMSEQKRRNVLSAIASEVDATDPECFFPRLTPELSRAALRPWASETQWYLHEAAKRARLERIVRRQLRSPDELHQRFLKSQ